MNYFHPEVQKIYPLKTLTNADAMLTGITIPEAFYPVISSFQKLFLPGALSRRSKFANFYHNLM